MLPSLLTSCSFSRTAVSAPRRGTPVPLHCVGDSFSQRSTPVLPGFIWVRVHAPSSQDNFLKLSSDETDWPYTATTGSSRTNKTRYFMIASLGTENKPSLFTGIVQTRNA